MHNIFRQFSYTALVVEEAAVRKQHGGVVPSEDERIPVELKVWCGSQGMFMSATKKNR